MRLAALISGRGSNMRALHERCRDGSLPAEIAVVLSSRAGAGGLERARRAGIPALCVDHRQFPRREDYDAALLESLAPFAVDLVLLAGFMRILGPTFVAPWRGRLLNIHPSLLPRHPGLHTHQRALEAGDSEAGATVHFVTEKLDGGPPVIQARVAVAPGDDAESLAARVLEQEHRIYARAVRWYCQGRLRLQGDRAVLDGRPISL